MNPLAVNSEADIFGRLIDTEVGELTKELAANILRVGFAEADHQKMHELEEKNQTGELTREEREELDHYMIVGDMLGIWQSKARQVLQQDQTSADEQTKICTAMWLRISGGEAELIEIEQQVVNYIDQIGQSKSDSVKSRCENRVVELEQQKANIATAIHNDTQALREAERAASSFQSWTSNLDELRPSKLKLRDAPPRTIPVLKLEFACLPARSCLPAGV